ncbi:hypothetical protein [Thermus sp.]|uniref:hypothetical protein n=1 Tax=Thermus sp. TaxID=275 RepID=UPI00298ED5BF|nr:hypothetical protein [Thermus sp.]
MEPEHAQEVARLSPTRYLARCACHGGTYHLHWDAGTFRLNQEDIAFLMRVLQEVLENGTGGVVWLGSVGLRFGPEEGEELLRLLRAGLALPWDRPVFWFRQIH